MKKSEIKKLLKENGRVFITSDGNIFKKKFLAENHSVRDSGRLRIKKLEVITITSLEDIDTYFKGKVNLEMDEISNREEVGKTNPEDSDQDQKDWWEDEGDEKKADDIEDLKAKEEADAKAKADAKKKADVKKKADAKAKAAAGSKSKTKS